jgi:hypothetical protein
MKEIKNVYSDGEMSEIFGQCKLTGQNITRYIEHDTLEVYEIFDGQIVMLEEGIAKTKRAVSDMFNMTGGISAKILQLIPKK